MESVSERTQAHQGRRALWVNHRRVDVPLLGRFPIVALTPQEGVAWEAL